MVVGSGPGQTIQRLGAQEGRWSVRISFGRNWSGGALDEDVRAVLYQAKAIRNLIAHNGGRVDSRFKEECAHFSVEVGGKFLLSSAQRTRGLDCDGLLRRHRLGAHEA